MGGSSDRLPRATLEQKIQILDFYRQSNRPQLETVDRYKNQLSISTSSFSEWLKNEDDLRSRLNEAGTDFTKQSRRKVKFKYEKINRAMDLLVQQKLERGEPVNEPILREHWSIYAHQYGVEDPKRLVGFSHGWLSQFKKRHGLNKKRMGGSPRNSRNGSTVSAGSNGSPEQTSPTNGQSAGVGNKVNGSVASSRSRGNVGTNTNSNTDADTSEVYDSAFTADPNNTSTNASNDPDGGANDYNTSATTANTYDLMSHTSNSTSQFRQPNLSYGTTHMSFGNYPIYPSNSTQGSQTSPQGQQTPQQVHPPQSQPGARVTPSSGSLPFDYPEQFRNLYSKEAQQQAQVQAQAEARAVAQQQAQVVAQQHRQQHQQQHQQHHQHQHQHQQQQQQQQQQDQQHSQLIPTQINTQLNKSNNENRNIRSGISGQPEMDFTSSINASDIERFIYMFADRYFHENSLEYPQTMKVFQEFKTTFLNERIQSMRNMQQQQLMSQAITRTSPNQISNIDDFFIRSAGGLPQSNNNGHDQDERSVLNNGINKWKK